MFDTLWKNIHVATMMPHEDGFGIINNAAIGVKGGKILYVGAESNLPSTKADETHDGEGCWVTPALIDCHTHLVYAGSRADEFEKRLNGVSYADIAGAGGGIMSTVHATRKASEEELLALAVPRVQALFNEGVTTIEIKSGYGLNTDNERKILAVATRIEEETGMRIRRTFLGAHALPPKFKDNPDGYIDLLCNEMIPQFAKEGYIDAIDAFCENIAFSTAQVARVFDTAKKYKIRVKLHAEQLSNSGGAALAAQYGALSADHLEYLDEAGAKAMSESGTVAVLLPGAFYHLRETKKPPVDLLRKRNIKIAVATDHNPGTSPTLSPLLMMNMACTLFDLTPAEALAATTRNAAYALDLQKTCGTLEKGKAADFVLWNIAHPRDLAACFGVNPARGLVMNGDYYDFSA